MVRNALVLATIVCALLAGCSPSEEPGTETTGDEPAPSSEDAAPSEPTTAAAGTPAITEDEAQQVLETYNRKNNKANAKLNSKLLKRIETESAFALDNAVYRIGHVLDPDNEDPIQPYEWVDPEFFIPALAEGAEPWFVAEVSTDSNSDERDLAVFTSEGQGEPWKIALYASLDEELPELARDADGNAIAVDPTAADGPATAPADIADAHAAYLTSGEDAPEAAGLGEHERSREIVDETFEGTDLRETFASAESFKRKVTVADHPVRALRTADGGAVTFYATRQRLKVRRKDGVFTVQGQLAALGADDVLVTPTGDEVFLVGMDITWLDAWIVAVPPEGGGETSVLGNQVGMVDVKGVDPSEYPENLPPELEALVPDRT